MILSITDVCKDSALLNIMSVVKRIILIIQIVVPILLLAFGTLSFIKLVKDPEAKNGLKKVYNQFIAAAIVFFLPIIVNAVMGLLGERTELSSCWNSANDQIVFGSKYYDLYPDQKKPIMIDPKKYEEGDSLGYDIAELAVRVAPIAHPHGNIYAPNNWTNSEISASCGGKSPLPNPWHPPSQVDPGYKDFEAIMDAVINASNPGNKAYGSCAQAAGGIIRAVADPDFDTSNPEGQIQYLQSNPEKWELVHEIKVGEKFADVCLPGDLLITDKVWTHTAIYVGNELVRQKFPQSKGNVFQAGYDQCDHARYPIIDYMETSPVPFYVYRPTGKGTFTHEFINWREIVGA